MSVSVCIPVRNEGDLLKDVLSNLITTAETEDFEIVLFNDGSTDSNARFKPLEIKTEFNLKIINSPVQYGVGYAFDRAVEACSNEIIVLMGADVYTDFGWLKSVKNAVETYPDSIGCSACVGISLENRDIHREGRKIRYGADMLIQVSMEDLPKNTQERLIAHKRNSYTNLFKAKWRWGKDSEEPYEIPCLLGAHYFTTKSFYQKIHGWDTEEHKRYQGHMYYGHLEPYLSLKAWLYGGRCMVHPNIETSHLFGRITKRNASQHRALRPSYGFWNALFMLRTMCNEDLAKYLDNWLNSELAVNRARSYVKHNYDNIKFIKERNDREMVRDIHWYMDKFGIKLK